MSSEHIRENDLIDLAGGLLSAERRRADLDHMQQCEECEKRFRALASDREHIRLAKQLRWTPGRLSVKPRTRVQRGLWLIAASILVTLGGMWGILQWTHGPAPAEYWLPQDLQPAVLRSGSAADAGSLADGLAAYREHDLGRAIRLLDDVEPSAGYEALRDIYLASALEKSGELTRAERILQRISLGTLPQPWFGRAHRVLYDVCLGAGRDRECRELLVLLAADPELGGWARQELERIGEIQRDEPNRTNPAQ